MAPGILRLRTVCCTLVIPIRLAICLPLLICTLNAYSPHAALFPTPQSSPPPPPQPFIINITRPRPALANPPEDTHRAPVYEYIALQPPPATGGGTRNLSNLGRALTLSFVLAAAALSVLSMVALWLPREQDASGGDADDATLVEAEGRGGTARWVRVGALVGGTATRLLLGALGTAAMVRVGVERRAREVSPAPAPWGRGSFVAVEVLGWLLVLVLYCGALHRVYCLVCHGSGALALQGGGPSPSAREVLPGGLVLEPVGASEPVSK